MIVFKLMTVFAQQHEVVCVIRALLRNMNDVVGVQSIDVPSAMLAYFSTLSDQGLFDAHSFTLKAHDRTPLHLFFLLYSALML